MVFHRGIALFFSLGLFAGPAYVSGQAESDTGEKAAELPLEADIGSSTESEELPYILEVEGAPQEEAEPEEAPKAHFEVEEDLRGKGNYELFRMAGEAYKRDELEKAAAYYHELIDRGCRHGDVFFNLANTYFRLSDQFGRAILYYEKALKLRPRDPDIAHNLAYARTYLIDEPPKTPPSALDTLLILHHQTTLNETLWILAGLNLLFVGTVLVKTLRLRFANRVSYGYLKGVVLTLFLLQIVSAGTKLWEENTFHEGIILNNGVQAKAAPTAQETLIEINSGTKVEILDSRSGYAHIRLPDGTPAYIPSNEIGEI